MSPTNWEADKMLDVYINDYFLKRNLHATARAFQTETRIPKDPVAIDAPGGFLMEWWSVFWDIFAARATNRNPDSAASSAPQQSLQQQSVAPQQRGKRQQQSPKQRRAPQQQFPRGATEEISSKNIPLKRQKTAGANALATKIYEERLKLPLQMERQRPKDNLTNLPEPYQMHMLRPTVVSTPLSGQMMHGMSGGSYGNLYQVHKSSPLNMGIRSEMNSVATSRTGREESLFVPTGLDQGVSNLPLKGWPLTGLDQFQLGLSPNFHNELQLQQQLMLQAQRPTLASASDLEAHNLRMLLNSTGNLNHSFYHGLPNVASSLQYGSPAHSMGDMDALIMHLLNINQQQKPYPQNSHLSQQSMDQFNLMQQEHLASCGVTIADHSFTNALVGSDQAPEHVIEPTREQPVPAAGAAETLDTANLPGPSSSSRSTLSAHGLGHATSVTSKASPTLCADAMDSLNSQTTQLSQDAPNNFACGKEQRNDIVQADMDHYVDNASVEEDVVRLPFSRYDIIGSDGKGLNNREKGCEGFSLEEIHLLAEGQNKVECCDFSMDGKLFVTGGSDKKATLWSTDSLGLLSKLEEHSRLVTDVRFSPSMLRLATSSADKTVRIWDVDHPDYSFRTFTGHSSPVLSLDFHPSRDDLVCSSDRGNEIRYWSIKSGRCSGVLKGGANCMRFQPHLGGCLAAAAENVVSLLDVESQGCRQKLQGHKKTVHTVCWDSTGDLLASVSEDLVRVWAVGPNFKGELVHELHGNKFFSCVFHPTLCSVLVIGSYQTLSLWDMKEDKKATIHAHDKLISCLAASDVKGFIASTSYDECVKIWK